MICKDMRRNMLASCFILKKKMFVFKRNKGKQRLEDKQEFLPSNYEGLVFIVRDWNLNCLSYSEEQADFDVSAFK